MDTNSSPSIENQINGSSYNIDGFERRQNRHFPNWATHEPIPNSFPTANKYENKRAIETIEISSEDESDTPPTKQTPDYKNLTVVELPHLKKEKLHPMLHNLNAANTSKQIATNPVPQSLRHHYNRNNGTNNIPVQTPHTNQMYMMPYNDFQNVMQPNQNNPNATITHMQSHPILQYQNTHVRNPQQPNANYLHSYNELNPKPYQSLNSLNGDEQGKAVVNYLNTTTNTSMSHKTEYPIQQSQDYHHDNNIQAFQREPLQTPSNKKLTMIDQNAVN